MQHANKHMRSSCSKISVLLPRCRGVSHAAVAFLAKVLGSLHAPRACLCVGGATAAWMCAHKNSLPNQCQGARLPPPLPALLPSPPPLLAGMRQARLPLGLRRCRTMLSARARLLKHLLFAFS